MRKSKFSESQIVGILKDAESGVPVAVKFAVIALGPSISRDSGLFVEVTEPVKLWNTYPAEAVAVTVVVDPALRYPPALTEPPTPEEVVR